MRKSEFDMSKHNPSPIIFGDVPDFLSDKNKIPKKEKKPVCKHKGKKSGTDLSKISKNKLEGGYVNDRDLFTLPNVPFVVFPYLPIL